MAMRSAAAGGFQYRDRDPGTAKARAAQSGGLYDSIIKSQFTTWRPVTGDNRIRVLPPTFDFKKLMVQDHYGMDIFMHRNVGADDGTYLCLEKARLGRCPICELHRRLQAEGNTEEADEIKLSKAVATWIIDRVDETTPKLWPMSYTIDRDILLVAEDKETGKILKLDSPTEGYDVMFKRIGEKFPNIKYSGYQVSRKEGPIFANPKKQQEVLDFILAHPVNTTLNYFDADYLERVVGGGTSGGSSKKEAEDDKGAEETQTADASSGDVPTEEQLDELGKGELAEVIEKHSLKIDPDDFPKVKELRAAIVEAFAALDSGDAQSGDAGEPGELPTSDQIDDMDEEELEKVVNAHGLDLDLNEFKRLRDKRDAVNEKLDTLRSDPGEGGGGDAGDSAKVPTDDEIGEMGNGELEEVIKTHGLDVDLTDYAKLAAKQAAVKKAISALGEGGASGAAEELPTDDELDDMGNDELAAVIKAHALDVDLTDYAKLAAKQAAVKKAIAAKGGDKKPAEKEKGTKTADTKADTKTTGSSAAEKTRERLAKLKGKKK